LRLFVEEIDARGYYAVAARPVACAATSNLAVRHDRYDRLRHTQQL
jgi:hypothetical protein